MITAMSRRFAVFGFLTLAGVAAVVARAGGVQGPRPPGAEFRGQAFQLTKVQEGIYHAEGTGALSVGGNAAVIVNDEDVLVVDSLSTPAAAWALAEQIKTITDKPIRYVVNTHFHWDHVHGNQIYGPGVEIIRMKDVFKDQDVDAIYADGAHLRAVGHELLARAIFERMKAGFGSVKDKP